MVCAKCQKKLKQTELATPGVKRKTEMYYGSPATTLGGSSSSSSSGAGAAVAGGKAKSSTLGSTGIGKVCISSILFFYLYYYCYYHQYWKTWMIMMLKSYRANSSAPKPRTPTRRMLPPVRFAKPKRSRGGSIVSGVRIRRMVRSFFLYTLRLKDDLANAV